MARTKLSALIEQRALRDAHKRARLEKVNAQRIVQMALAMVPRTQDLFQATQRVIGSKGAQRDKSVRELKDKLGKALTASVGTAIDVLS